MTTRINLTPVLPMPGLLFLLFLTLKLCGTIHWSWWWVTAPMWIPFGIFVAFFMLAFAVAVIVARR